MDIALKIVEKVKRRNLLHVPATELFEKRIVRFLKNNKFTIPISFKGNRKFYDRRRKFPDGHGRSNDLNTYG